MVAGEAADGGIGDGRQRRWIERKISRQPGVFRQRQHVAECGAFGNAARDEIRRLEREFRRAPALRQGGKFAPIGSVMIPCRARSLLLGASGFMTRGFGRDPASNAACEGLMEAALVWKYAREAASAP